MPANVVGGIHEVFRVIAALGCAVCVVKSFRARERLERIEWLVSATLLAVLACQRLLGGCGPFAGVARLADRRWWPALSAPSAASG